MTLGLGGLKDWRVLFAVVCAVVLAAEAYWLFVHTARSFRIEGTERYEIEELGRGVSVSHAFYMSGDGLSSVRVRVTGRVATRARIAWTLWRGSRDSLPMTPAEIHDDQLVLRPGPQWLTFDVVRDGSSHDQWYTFEIRVVEAAPIAAAPAVGGPLVTVTASRDNPDRGGVLWVGDTRQPGSLIIRADRNGRTLYRRFVLEAVPHLPRVFQNEAFQWLIALALHGALIGFAYAVLREADQLNGAVASR